MPSSIGKVGMSQLHNYYCNNIIIVKASAIVYIAGLIANPPPQLTIITETGSTGCTTNGHIPAPQKPNNDYSLASFPLDPRPYLSAFRVAGKKKHFSVCDAKI